LVTIISEYRYRLQVQVTVTNQIIKLCIQVFYQQCNELFRQKPYPVLYEDDIRTLDLKIVSV